MPLHDVTLTLKATFSKIDAPDAASAKALAAAKFTAPAGATRYTETYDAALSPTAAAAKTIASTNTAATATAPHVTAAPAPAATAK